MSQTHHRTCNLCEALCGISIETDGTRVLSIRGDEADPLSQGHLCPKALALADLHEDPDRLRVPMRRVGPPGPGARWQEISWKEALDEAATLLAGVQQRGGVDALATYVGNPIGHNYGAVLFASILGKALGTRSRYSSQSMDALPHLLASYLVFGHQALLPVPDLERTNHLLMIGANPAASGGSVMSGGNIMGRLAELRARGGRVVVVDPRRNETAEKADRHVFIRPGADAWFLLALAQTIFEEGLTAPGRLADFTDGLDAVRRLVKPFSPERVAHATGIDAATIRELARDFAGASGAACYGRIGVSQQELGTLSCWLLLVINTITGNLDRVGGVLFAKPAVDSIALATRIGRMGSFATYRSRVRGLPEFADELPVAVMAEEMETPGQGQLRGLLSIGGNPVLSAPNGMRIERALAKLDAYVAIDIYRNETTQYAHLILPPTSPLERDHFDVVLSLLSVRNYARYSEPLFTPPKGALHDWQIMLELATRLGAKRSLGKRLLAPLKRGLFRRLSPARVLDLLLRMGPYGARGVPFRKGLSLKRLTREHPHGIDLGPLAPSLPGKLGGRRIQLLPEHMVSEIARAAEQLRVTEALPGPGRSLPLAMEGTASAASGELLLIGRRHLRSNNSWMHNSQRLVKGPERCTLLMHPDDARARGLENGQHVELSSRIGTLEVPLEISDEMMPGVISVPHGWGHARPGVQLRVAAAHPGVSINDITDDTRVDALTGMAAFSGQPVQVRRITR